MSAHTRQRRRLALTARAAAAPAAFALAALIGAVVAYYAIFSVLLPHDDEGYILVSLREYNGGGALYDRVYSQYGPFFYEVVGGFFRATGIAIVHDNGRLFTVGVWVLTSLLVGWGTYRMTRNLVCGICADLLAFYLLIALTHEPMHPSGFVMLLLGALLVAVVELARRESVVAAGVAGALVAGLALTKINVGAFAFVALAFAGIATSTGLRRRTPTRIAAAAIVVLVPFVLIGGKLAQEPFLRVAVVVGASALAIAVVAIHPSRAEPNDGWRMRPIVGATAIGAGVVAVLCVLLAFVHGTSASGLLHGVLIDPVRQPGVFANATVYPGWAIDAAFLAVVVAAFVTFWPGLVDERLRAVGGFLRAGAGLAIWFSIAAAPGESSLYPDRRLGVALPLAWLAALPMAGENPRRRLARTFLPVLAALEVLQAFPVSGSQESFAAVLFAAVGGVCVADGWTLLRTSLSPIGAPSLTVLAALAGFAVTLRVAVPAYVTTYTTYHSLYEQGMPLQLYGATRIHVSPDAEISMVGAVKTIRQHCPSFLTLPGLDSLYLYTREKPPTTMNATSWMFLLDDRQQRLAVAQAERQPRLCVVKVQPLVDFWSTGRPLPQRPLMEYIQQRFHKVATYGVFEILGRNRRA